VDAGNSDGGIAVDGAFAIRRPRRIAYIYPNLLDADLWVIGIRD